MLKTVTRIMLAMVVPLGLASLAISTAQAVVVIPSLELRISRASGMTQIITNGTPATSPDTNGTANLASYTIADISGASLDVWIPGNWSSITSQELPGSGWGEVPPEAPLTQSQALSELNLSGSKAFAFGDVVSLGNIYDPTILSGAIGFTYGLAGSATPFVGNVVFEGLLVPSPLELHVNRFTGETRIVGMQAADPTNVAVPVNLASYTIGSNSANPPLGNVWMPGNWSSITSQEAAGSGWGEVPPETPLTQNQLLTELNLTSSKAVAPGDVVSLGTIYDLSDTKTDITFTYGLAGSVNPIAGNVVYDGVGLRLQVNKLTGKVEIINDETANVNFDAYEIQSASGDLNIATWNSLQNQAVPGWTETGSSNFGIAELNQPSSSALAGASVLDLGAAYQGGVGGVEDLSFKYSLSGGRVVSGVIEYLTTIPGDFDTNGSVEGADFLFWQRNLGDAPNLALWESNFGASAAIAALTTAVPEPASGGLLFVAFGALAMVRRRRTKKLCFIALVLGIFSFGGFLTQNTWADDNQNGLIPFTSDWNDTTKTGTPLFPFGWWSNDPDQSHFVSEGVSTNITHSVVLSQIPSTQVILDSAQANGIKMMVGISASVGGPIHQLVPGTNGDFQQIVNTFKDHPALASWLIGDENSDRVAITPTHVSEAITELRLLDPNHQAHQVFGHDGGMAPILPYIEDVVTMQPNTNTMAFDYYRWFVGESEFGGVDSLTGQARPKDYLTKLNDMSAEALTRNMSVGINLQGFGGGSGGINFEAHRFGTANEFRWYTFAAMASAGARQVMLWDHQDRTAPGGLANFETTVANPVWAELGMIQNAMETGYNVGNVALSFTPEAGWIENFNEVSDLLLNDDTAGAIYLILTRNDGNVPAKNVAVTLSGLPLGMSNMTIPKTGEVIALTDLGGGSYSFNDTLGDYEVNLYQIDYIPGDFDGDGLVDMVDFGILSASFFSTGNGVNRNGELTGDGVVDIFDFNKFKGTIFPGGASAFEAALASSVPEPCTIVLLLAAVPACLSLRFRRRKVGA